MDRRGIRISLEWFKKVLGLSSTPYYAEFNGKTNSIDIFYEGDGSLCVAETMECIYSRPTVNEEKLKQCQLDFTLKP